MPSGVGPTFLFFMLFSYTFLRLLLLRLRNSGIIVMMLGA